jgi:CHAT domain-containing protein
MARGSSFDQKELDLPEARAEIESLALLQAGARQALIDDRATYDNVVTEVPKHDVVHFACHGEFEAAAPHLSGLALHDRSLTVRDLEDLPLERLRLAVLHACWGANALVLPGREMVGLAATFVRRGCGALITALWDIPAGPAPTAQGRRPSTPAPAHGSR